MKNCFFFIICILLFYGKAKAQVLSTSSNRPSQVYPGAGSIAAGPDIFGVFVGRTPCQELLKELNMPESPACTKRKMSIILYKDPRTGEPTTYSTRGFGKWTGKGKWQIIHGTPANALDIVFRIELDAVTSLYLLKGDDNVLFILDRNRNFLPGNEKFSYTLNRARN